MNLFQKSAVLFLLLGSLFVVHSANAAVVLVTTTPVPTINTSLTPTPLPTVIGTSPTPCIGSVNGTGSTNPNCIMVDQNGLGFRIPTFSEILTFTIRGFFIAAGLTALFYLLLGAFSWITSGGEKEKVGEAQKKIQAAVIGLIMIVVVLSLVITLEQVVFGGKLCFGLSCPITIPSLLKDPNSTTAPPAVGSFNFFGQSPTAGSTSSATLAPTPFITAPAPTVVPTSPVTPTSDSSLTDHPYR